MAALEAGQALTHPFVVGELACGNLKNRVELLSLLLELPPAPVATDAEALDFIDRRELMGRGIGYLVVHLLASAALAGTARLGGTSAWRRLRRLTVELCSVRLTHLSQLEGPTGLQGA